MVKIMFTVLIAVFCAGLANLFLSKGMEAVGPFALFSPVGVAEYFLKTVTNFWILLGIFFVLVYFFLWLAVLSWVEVSWALPMNAIEYFFVAILASLFLGESITWPRWIGIGFISVGIVFMVRSLESSFHERETDTSGNY